MKTYDGLRAKAKAMRMEGLSLPEICERLSLSKGTVHHWVKGIPLQRASRSGSNLKKSAKNHLSWSNMCKKRRQDSYRVGQREYSSLISQNPTFRDFVTVFLTEGYRKGRHGVSMCNSNPKIVILTTNWLRKLSTKEVRGHLQYQADQNVERLLKYWVGVTGIPKDKIRIALKSNSGKLSGRKWRCKHGVFSVMVHETSLRERMQAWCDLIEDEWTSE